jgi:hypothetical protein
MKRSGMILLFMIFLVIVSCNKDESERFKLLTGPMWVSHELLVDGEDASAGLLANFKGEAKFNEDGTGSFGELTGTWTFAQNETQIRISTPAYPFPIVTDIEELTATTLKISTMFPNLENLQETLDIWMSFKAK